MKVKKELQEWVDGFDDYISYHNGDYQQGMTHVLSGIRGQLNWIGNLEVQNLKDFVVFVNKNIWDKPSNTMEQHLNDFLSNITICNEKQ